MPSESLSQQEECLLLLVATDVLAHHSFIHSCIQHESLQQEREKDERERVSEVK